jgi:hypothetical protein
MAKERDWLWVDVPANTLTEQEEGVRELIQRDPDAAAITDEEAEAFMASAYSLRTLHPRVAPRIGMELGLRISHNGPKALRRVVQHAMRRWNEPRVRALIHRNLVNSGYEGFPCPADGPDTWTEEAFTSAYHSGLDLAWLTWVTRYLGKADSLPAWLRALNDDGERRYRTYLDIARLVMRRLLAPMPDAALATAEMAAASQAGLANELREKDRAASTLRQNVRHLNQDRSKLKELARRAELEARVLLPQARGEVAAARKALKERLAARERELAEQARHFQSQAAAIRAQMAGARDEFLRVLSDRAAHSPLNLLGGRTVTVSGKAEDQEIYRLLVESLGGRLASDGGEVTTPAPPTFAALEQQLRSLALERVLIKCDGLYRRKGERPGVAVSAFQVWLDREMAGQHSSVVCCGPLAGSLMAEYGAVAMALSWLVAVGPPPGAKLEIWSDCRVLVSRVRRPKPLGQTPGCVMLDLRVRRLLRQLQQRGCEVRLRWVPRDEVYTVDRLCDVAYRGLKWYHRRSVTKPRTPLSAFIRSITPS